MEIAFLSDAELEKMDDVALEGEGARMADLKAMVIAADRRIGTVMNTRLTRRNMLAKLVRFSDVELAAEPLSFAPDMIAAVRKLREASSGSTQVVGVKGIESKEKAGSVGAA